MDDKPIREVKPVVVPAQLLVWGPLLSGFVALGPALVVGLIVLFVSEIPNEDDPYMPSVYQWGLVLGCSAAIYALAFVAGIAVAAINAYKGPGGTSYTIYPDRVECCEGVWVRTRRAVALDQVVDVVLTEGLLQQTRGAGTVMLMTRPARMAAPGNDPQSKEDTSLAQPGGTVELVNVPQPREVYDLVRSLVSKKP